MQSIMDRIMQRSVCFFGGGGGGGTSTNTVYQETELSKTQAEILKAFAPYLESFGASTFPSLATLTNQQIGALSQTLGATDLLTPVQLQNLQGRTMLGLEQYLAPQLMQQIQGQPTGQQVQNLTNVQNMMRKNMANMGVGAGDPRLMQMSQQGTEALTKPAAVGGGDALSTIMGLYGSPSGTAGLGMGLGASQATSPNAMNPAALISMMGQTPFAGSSSTSKYQSSTMGDIAGGIGSAATATMMAYLIMSML